MAYAHSDPVHVIDPSGRFGLIATLDSGVSNAVAQVSRGFSVSATAGGQALRTLGMVVEQSVDKILVRRLGSNAIERGVQLFGPGGRRVIDFMLRIGDRVSYLEVKYGLPRKAGPALARLVGQMRTATAAAAEVAEGEVVLFTWAAPSEAQMVLLLAELGEGASAVRIINGFVNLSQYLRIFLLGI
jgi:hypothetical protein